MDTCEKIYNRFYRLSLLMRKVYPKDCPYTPAQVKTLACIRESKLEVINQKNIQEILGVKASTVSVLITKLENLECIERLRDENDKRNIKLKITDLGNEVVDLYYDKQKQASKEIFSVLTEEEQVEFEKMISKLIESFNS